MRYYGHLAKIIMAALACIILLLSACGREQNAFAGESVAADKIAEVQAASSAADNSLAAGIAEPPEQIGDRPEQEREKQPARTQLQALSEMMIDPPYDFDINEMLPCDFGDFFTAQYPVKRSEQIMLEGTPYQTVMTTIEASQPGDTVFIVAGVHGDETAGWSTGDLIAKGASIKKGKLIIISPANSNGAKNSTRYVKDRLDLNRSFPGDKNGNAAEVIADEIYNRVKESGACLLLDLHEARIVNSKADFLGSSVIYTELDKMDDLFFDLIFAAQTGEICSEPFNYHFPAPEGSINHEVTCGLGIPSITIETFRGYQLERRISDQLDIVQYVLRYFGML